MKKSLIMVIILISLVIVGCNTSFTYDCDNPCEGMSREEIRLWVKDNISGKKDFLDYWQSPKETLRLRTGDCEDYCVLYIWLMYKNFGEEYELVGVKTGAFTKHAMVNDFTEYLYEPQIGANEKPWSMKDVVKVYSFDELFNKSTLFGVKSLSN